MKAAAQRLLLPALFAAGLCVFAALGVWQLERRAWKLDLIERVQVRVSSAPVPLPNQSQWAVLAPRDVEYRRVAVRGNFLHDRETLVDALTERGAGYWVMTPLKSRQGIVLVNRGFVPPEKRAPATRAASRIEGEVQVIGLARLSEPGGRILRSNRPPENRWYSRDVAAIASARGISGAAPFFIDAGAAPNAGGFPVGGLTVLHFRNAHLAYALIWFTLSALCGVGLWLVCKRDR